MKIKSIFEEISEEPGTNAKMDILRKYSENEILERVLYLAESKRIKFYIKQIPDFQYIGEDKGIEWALEQIMRLSSREFTGTVAINHLQYILSSINPDDQYVIERIISKDLKIGMGKNINKVFPGLIEETPYMGAKSYSEKLARKIFEGKGEAVSQVKMDGRYCNVIIRHGDVEMESRAGEPTILGDCLLIKKLSNIKEDIVLNGELTVSGVPVRRTANGIIASIIDIQSKIYDRTPEETQKKINNFLKRHSEDFGFEISFQEALDRVELTCWDVISPEEYYDHKSLVPYHNRLDKLYSIASKYDGCISVVESKYVDTFEDAMSHFQELLSRGEEGTILKSLGGAWKNGKPNWQVKMKLEIDIDLKIVGFQMGTPGTKNENWVSTLQLESSCGLLKTNPSGMDEKMMQYVTENQDKLLGKVVEIRCCGLSQDKEGNWSTLHPSVVEIRDDKNECDSLNSAIKIEDAAKGILND